MKPLHSRIGAEEAARELAALADLWETKRSTQNGLPARGDFSLEELKRWMGNLAIYEVETGEPFRLRTRLMGTKVVEADQSEHTNQFLDQYCPKAEYERVFDAYREAWKTRKPAYRWRSEIINVRQDCWAKKLVLPLAKDGMSIDMFLVALYMGFPDHDYFDRTLIYV